MPTPNGSDDFIRISRPGERLGTRIGFSDVPVDGLLKIDHRTEDAALEPLAGQLGEEAFNGIEPRAGCRDKVEGEALVAVEPGADLRVLVSRIVVEDDVHGFIHWHLGFNGVQEADELLMPVTLHVAPNKVPTPKESANLILQRFKINHLGIGDMLLTGPLMMFFQQEGFSSKDLQKGLDYASERNWIEIDNTTVFLTDQGFAQM